MPGLDVGAAATRAAVLAGDHSLSATGCSGGTRPPPPGKKAPAPHLEDASLEGEAYAANTPVA